MSANDLGEFKDPEIKSPRSVLAMFRTGISQKELEYIPLGAFIEQHSDYMIAETLFNENQDLRKQCIKILQDERNKIISDGIYEEEYLMFPMLPKSMVKRQVELEGFLRYAGNDKVYPKKVVEKKDASIWTTKEEIKEGLIQEKHKAISDKCKDMYDRTENELNELNETKRTKLEELIENNKNNIERHLDAKEQIIRDSVIPLETIMDPVNAAYNNYQQLSTERKDDLKQKGLDLADKQMQMINQVNENRQNYQKEQLKNYMERSEKLKSIQDMLNTTRTEEAMQKKEKLQSTMARTEQQCRDLREQFMENMVSKMTQKWTEESDNVEKCRQLEQEKVEEKKEFNKTHIGNVLEENNAIKTEQTQEILERDQILRDKQENAVKSKLQRETTMKQGYLDKEGRIKQRELMALLEQGENEYQKKLTAMRLEKIKSILE